jgi:hypothetical protein
MPLGGLCSHRTFAFAASCGCSQRTKRLSFTPSSRKSTENTTITKNERRREEKGKEGEGD